MSNDVVASGSNSGTSQFPAGLRILLVDDCRCSLSILKMMLEKCNYRVTTCSNGKDALTLLQEHKDGFDLVLADVHIPEMDGIQLLQAITPEMDVPVVLISSDLRPQTIIKAMKNGACDYLDKPGRMEQYKNLWQHVFRKKVKKENRKRSQRDADETDNAETTTKKLRVKWTPALHQKFIAVVNYLGIDKAAPKRVLELMDISTLTKDNVASHLQKFRVFLKKSEHQDPGRISPETLAAVSSFTLNSADFGKRPLTLNGISMREPSHIAIQEAPQQLNWQLSRPLLRIPENSPVVAQQSPHLLYSQPSCNPPLYSQATRIQPIVSVQTQEQRSLQMISNPLLAKQNSMPTLSRPMGFYQEGEIPQSRIFHDQSLQTSQMPVQTRAQASLQTISNSLLVNQNSVTAISQSMGFSQEGEIPQQPLSNYWAMNNSIQMNHASNIHVSVQNPSYTVSRGHISVETRNVLMMQNYHNHGSVSSVEIETSDHGQARNHGLVGESNHSQTVGNNLGVNEDNGRGDNLSDYFDIPTHDWGPNNYSQWKLH